MRNVAASARAELGAFCETDPQTLKRVAERYPKAKAYSDLDTALADTSIDAVMIASPSSLHHAHASKALEGGKARICGKAAGRNRRTRARTDKQGVRDEPDFDGRSYISL